MHEPITTSIDLPAPRRDGGTPFYSAVSLRRTVREIVMEPLSLEQLSNMLWAAYGVNRTDGPFGALGRTAASASNSQEIDIYVALEHGTYLYNAITHRLDRVNDGDLRTEAMNRRQGTNASAPVQLIYVVNIDRLTDTRGFNEPGLHDPEVQKSYYYVDTGLIAQNVYLFAAATGLACWFHNCDKAALTRDLALGSEQRVLFAQSVGLPANPEAVQ